MEDLAKRAYLELAVRVAFTRAVALFALAWTVRYWQAWLFLAITFVADLGTTHYLVRKDPALLARRMKVGAAAELTQDRVRMQVVIRLAVLIVLVAAGLDHRLGWSHVPAVGCLAADLVVAAGLILVWLTFRANSFASNVVEVERDQIVVNTGPYALVRHPMYTGLILMVAGSGPALGSWWALIGAVTFAIGIVVRLLEEEQFLSGSLVGYEEYRSRVRHRLAPLVW
jgi:protein-S-isoprenylcysteine O-methyltransferase Ste14